MGLKFWFMCFLVICSCVAYEAKKPDSKKAKSKIKERLKAVENLVRSEFNYVHENIEVGRVERELLRQKLNETLELLDMSKMETDRAERAKLMKNLNDTLELLDEKIERLANENFESDKMKREKLIRKLNKVLKSLDISEINEKIEACKEDREKLWKTLNDTLKLLLVDTSLVITEKQEYGKVKGSDIDLLIMKIEKNDDTIEELSEGLLRIERGFMEEKKSRKGMTENYENMVRAVSDLDNVTRALLINSELLGQKLDALGKEINTLGKTKVRVKLDNKTLGLTPESSTSNAAEEIATETSIRKETVISKEAQEWSVRLIGGRGPHEGRVEVNYGGRHGTICDHGWGNDDARVVCKMLGYSPSRAKAYFGPRISLGHTFGEGTGEILLSYVACQGDEDSLFSCKHKEIGVHNCNHGNDAGVRCRTSA